MEGRPVEMLGGGLGDGEYGDGDGREGVGRLSHFI